MTPNVHFRPDGFGALPHPPQAPMPGAPALYGWLVDPTAIVTNLHSHASGFIGDFRFDLCRMGVPERVRHRLSPDVIRLFAESLTERPGRPDHGETEWNSMILGKQFTAMFQCACKV